MKLPDVERKNILAIASGNEKEKTNRMFGSVAMVASLGDVLGKTQKEKNDWKARMLKAGLAYQGLTMPDDWESLPEAEKTKRLDSVISLMKNKNMKYPGHTEQHDYGTSKSDEGKKSTESIECF